MFASANSLEFIGIYAADIKSRRHIKDKKNGRISVKRILHLQMKLAD